MIARATAALLGFFSLAMSAGGDGVLLLPTVWMWTRPQVNRSAAEPAGSIRWTGGGPGESGGGGSGADEITLGGMNAIGPRPCHQHTGPQLFFHYIVKGSDAGKETLQAVLLDRVLRLVCTCTFKHCFCS